MYRQSSIKRQCWIEFQELQEIFLHSPLYKDSNPYHIAYEIQLRNNVLLTANDAEIEKAKRKSINENLLWTTNISSIQLWNHEP